MADRPSSRTDAFFAAVVDHPPVVLAAFGLVTLLAASQLPGTTVQICRRHYAQFVPRDRHEEDIERLQSKRRA